MSEWAWVTGGKKKGRVGGTIADRKEIRVRVCWGEREERGSESGGGAFRVEEQLS